MKIEYFNAFSAENQGIRNLINFSNKSAEINNKFVYYGKAVTNPIEMADIINNL